MVTPAQILTPETIPAYLSERLNHLKGVVDSVDGIVQIDRIQGGNVNYAFCITLDDGMKIFLKQAPEFVAIFGPDGFPLTSQRMQLEMDVYEEWKDLLIEGGDDDASEMLPDIYYFDKSHMVVIMEFLDGYEMLDHMLVENIQAYHPDISKKLGTFMGQVHSQTHSSKISNQERKDYLMKHFENREMRDIQLEFVYTKCFQEATDEQRIGLTVTPEFMKEVELLKQQYNAKAPEPQSLVLAHGDLHPGSVMASKEGNAKVIDPEFTVYGPPGLDVGSLLSGYCLAAIHQVYANNLEAAQTIVNGAQTVWSAYKEAMKEMEESFQNDDVLHEIGIQTVGFTLIEVCRTAMGFAGGRLWLQFEDPTVKAASKKAALELVSSCMIARHKAGIQVLFDNLQALATTTTGTN